jgi:hypothetical protein
MNPRKQVVVKEAVMEGFVLLQRQWGYFNPSVKKFYMVLGALVVAGLITAGVCQLTANGDINVLKQRLVGEVHLSTGNYSARTLGELNQLSWENGLEMLTALDMANDNIKSLETLQAQPGSDPHDLAKSRYQLKKSLGRVHALLQDRKVLLKSAKLFRETTLYTPVYHEYLSDTMKKVALLKRQAPPAEQMVLKQ